MTAEELKEYFPDVKESDYDYVLNNFRLRTDYSVIHLHYVGDGVRVRNPKGNTLCCGMFSHWGGEMLDLSCFDTSGVITMEDMFSKCYNLQTLDLCLHQHSMTKF